MEAMSGTTTLLESVISKAVRYLAFEGEGTLLTTSRSVEITTGTTIFNRGTLIKPRTLLETSGSLKGQSGPTYGKQNSHTTLQNTTCSVPVCDRISYWPVAV